MNVFIERVFADPRNILPPPRAAAPARPPAIVASPCQNAVPDGQAPGKNPRGTRIELAAKNSVQPFLPAAPAMLMRRDDWRRVTLHFVETGAVARRNEIRNAGRTIADGAAENTWRPMVGAAGFEPATPAV